MENKITYKYQVKEVELIDKDGYIDVIESINYTLVAEHEDGRVSSTEDSYTFDLGNLGYKEFGNFDSLTKEQITIWLKSRLKNTIQDSENKKQLIKEIRAQTTPYKKVVSFD